jgi:hypothetical protein
MRSKTLLFSSLALLGGLAVPMAMGSELHADRDVDAAFGMHPSTTKLTAPAPRVVQYPGKATLGHDGNEWVWKGHHGRWVWKPGQFRATHDGGSTQYWWHWDD